MAIFRIKFAYEVENKESGAIDKVKTEVLAQCVNYTDAESLAIKLIELDEMSKTNPADYEIIKQKFTHADLELTDKVMSYDRENLINGLVEHYFEEEEFHIYNVKMAIPFEDENGKKKFERSEAYVSASNAVDAINYYRSVLESNGNQDIIVKAAKMDDAISVYLTPETHAQVFNRQLA